jgi:hypothetical protein
MTDLNVNLKDTIINRQNEDAFLAEELNRILEGRESTFELRERKSLWFQGRICGNVLVEQHGYVEMFWWNNIPEIKEMILKETHQTPYSIHLGSTKMYMDLKEIFWWNNMKREIAKYVFECHTSHKVTAEHQSPAGKITTITDTNVEMERNRNGFYLRITHDQNTKRYDLGNC